MEDKKIKCPSCFAEIRVSPTEERVTCKYCDSIIELNPKEQIEENVNNQKINASFMVDEMVKEFNALDVNWKDFIERFVSSNQFSATIEKLDGKSQVVDEIKDHLYENLPYDNHNNVSISETVKTYFDKEVLVPYDLVALAGIIRHGFEQVVVNKEKHLNIKYAESNPTFSNRVKILYGELITSQVMKYWRNCSAIIHHDDTSPLFFYSVEEKLNLLKDAYDYLVHFS